MKNDEINSIQAIVIKLKKAGALGINEYEKRLLNNSGNEDNLNDLLAEGKAAIMFLENKFKVIMQDKPDLKIELNGDIAYVEVKHYRTNKQDFRIKKAMRKELKLVCVSNIPESEGGEPWLQIADRAIYTAEKNQFMKNAPNLLVLVTDSNSINMIWLQVAIDFYNEYASLKKDPRLYDLNAIMILDKKLYIGGRTEENGTWSRNVNLRQTASATTPMKPCMLNALENIHLWW
jgi:hypothetical protein